MSASDTVQVSIEVDVDPAQAFQVFTEDVDSWWQRGPRYRFVAPFEGRLTFEPGIGGRLLHEHPDGASFEVGQIRVWEPGRRLLLSWRLPNFAPHEFTEVEVQFTEIESGTRVTVVHRGLDALRPDHPARHGKVGHQYVMFLGRWWSQLLGSLQATLTRGEPRLR